MNIGGLALIILIVAGAVVGMYAIAANTTMTSSPVDTYGRTTSTQDNLTRANVSATAQVAPTATVFLAIIGGVILLFGTVIFFVGARNHRFNSRY